jgi:hypothetical protein
VGAVAGFKSRLVGSLNGLVVRVEVERMQGGERRGFEPTSEPGGAPAGHRARQCEQQSKAVRHPLVRRGTGSLREGR